MTTDLAPIVALEAPNVVVREKILTLQERMKQALSDGLIQEPDCPLTHHFAPDAYGREIHIPKGALVVGKIHRHAHVNVLSQGKVSVMTEDGPETFEAPRTWISSPGTKRVVYAHEDVVWTTIHVTKERDLDVIEDYVIAKTYEEYDSFRLKQLAIHGETGDC